MDAYEILRLISASLCGMQIGAFLLLSLLNRPLLADWPENTETIWIFKRLYRLNTVLAVLAGIAAIFGEARQTGMYLAILGVSYVIAHMHLLNAIQTMSSQLSTQSALPRTLAKRNLKLLFVVQQTLHLVQILALIGLIYYLI